MPSQPTAEAPQPLVAARATGTSRRQPEGTLSYLNPGHVAGQLWRHRGLIGQFARREVEGRYRGSFLGLFWTLIHPLVLLVIYTFVFGIVFRARWPHSRGTGLGEFAVVLFCGLIAYNLFGECVTRASGLVVAVPNYVRKVVFPLEILPVAVLGSALFHASVSLAVLLAVRVALGGSLPWTLVLLPLVALPLVLLSLGLTWFLASLGVFVRDVGYLVTLGLQVLLFATPIFYSLDAVPPRLLPILRLNPLGFVVESARRVVLWGELPHGTSWALWTAVSGLVMLLGYAWFMKTKRGFADVL